MTLTSGYLLPSRTVSEALETTDVPLEVVREIHRRLSANGQRDTRDALRSFISAARVVGERGRDRTGTGFGTEDEKIFTALTFAVDELEM